MSIVARVVCSVVGLTTLLAFFINVPILVKFDSMLITWGVIVSAFAMGLGTINLARRNIVKIMTNSRKGQQNWTEIICSGANLFFMFGVIIVGVIGTTNNQIYKFGVAAILEPSTEAISSLITFYIATSAFRAFRARNLEAALLLGTGIIVMLGQAPIASVLHERLPDAANWLMQIINVGGQRGIIISAALGMLASGLRVLLGIDQGPWKG